MDLRPLWTLQLTFSLETVSDDPVDIFKAARDEARKIIEQIHDVDFCGVLWQLDDRIGKYHFGRLFIILTSQNAAMFKLATTTAWHDRLKPLEDVIGGS